jgi:nitronate monooxygenase
MADAVLPTTDACRLLGIRHPIVQAPMAGGWTTPELVAAASNAGALGSLAAARLSEEALDAALARVRALTTAPFAVNFLLAAPDRAPHDAQAAAPMRRLLDAFRARHGLPPAAAPLALPPAVLDAQLAAVLAAGVRVVSFAMGDPGALIERVHAAGALAAAAATTVAEAETLAARGADVVVAQGAEAGGHRATFAVDPDGGVPLVGTMALVPQVVDAVRCPVLASGGIMDARGVVAALALGASGVQMGTRFLLARESGAGSAYRARLLTARETDTEVTSALTGRPARALRNELLETLRASGLAPLPWPYQSLAAADLFAAAHARDDADLAALLAGQGLRLARRAGSAQGAAEIVDELARDGARLLRSLAPG